MIAIASDHPLARDVQVLLDRHLDFARGVTPIEHAHALDANGLVSPDISFFSARGDDGRLLGVGALKALDDSHMEIKSMHTAVEARGRGVGRAIVQHLLEVARARGATRVSLETGTMAAFAPARTLYASIGFEQCEPFGEYAGSSDNTFMTLMLE